MGHAVVRPVHLTRLAEYNGIGEGGLIYTGSFDQLGTQALGAVIVFVFVFTLS